MRATTRSDNGGQARNSANWRDLERSLQVTCGEAYSALRGWRPIPAAPLVPPSRFSGLDQETFLPPQTEEHPSAKPDEYRESSQICQIKWHAPVVDNPESRRSRERKSTGQTADCRTYLLSIGYG